MTDTEPMPRLQDSDYDWDQCELAEPTPWYRDRWRWRTYARRTSILSCAGLVLASQAAQLLHLTGVLT